MAAVAATPNRVKDGKRSNKFLIARTGGGPACRTGCIEKYIRLTDVIGAPIRDPVPGAALALTERPLSMTR